MTTNQDKQTPFTLPALADGERYLCGFVRADGSVEHSILLPCDHAPASWKKQMDWAKSIGGDLLNRVEQAFAFAEMPEEFEKTAYWSNSQHASDSDSAWYQGFSHGHQYDYDTYSKLRARAVRRLIIQ